MKCFKKATGLLLITAMAFSLSACGNENGKASEKAAEEGVITLRILENDTAKSEGYLDELLNAFNEAYKDKGIVAVDANMDEYSNLAEKWPLRLRP